MRFRRTRSEIIDPQVVLDLKQAALDREDAERDRRRREDAARICKKVVNNVLEGKTLTGSGGSFGPITYDYVRAELAQEGIDFVVHEASPRHDHLSVTAIHGRQIPVDPIYGGEKYPQKYPPVEE